MGLGNKAGNGLQLFNRALAEGRAVWRIVLLKRPAPSAPPGSPPTSRQRGNSGGTTSTHTSPSVKCSPKLVAKETDAALQTGRYTHFPPHMRGAAVVVQLPPKAELDAAFAAMRMISPMSSQPVRMMLPWNSEWPSETARTCEATYSEPS